MEKTSYSNFEFIRTLGQGTFSTVYLVRRKKDQKQYALKSIIMGKLKENEQQNSVNEIRILASINHPNVIGYKESFWNEKNKTLNIVMEYCDDGDLETKINNMKRNKQRFEEIFIWNYFIQIIRGLKSLHAKKIIHRDLKSANIFLLKENNQCKIGDLNVSKVMKEKFLQCPQIGTPTYSSPEIWKNQPYSYKSDLWSVGCIIYEMCCLRPPFRGKDIDELGKNICIGKFEKISNRYSEELWNIIKMLLEKDVNKRADCDMILNNRIIKDKIKELNCLDVGKNSFFNYLNEEDDSSLLDTIEYKNLRDLENKIPNKRKYDKLPKKFQKNRIITIRNNNNINKNDNNNEETIKNDSSFDEYSNISENKPSKDIIINNSNTNNNNLIFKRARKEKINNIFNNIFTKIKNEGMPNKSLNTKNKSQSYIILTFKNNYLNLNFDDYEFKLNKSQEIFNNKLIVPKKIKKYKKINVLKYKTNEDKKLQRDRKNPEFIERNKTKSNLSNIIFFPENKIIKSGLLSLKEEIAKKKSQRELSVNSYIKKFSDEKVHQVSNSNPKLLKNNNIIKNKNIMKNNSVKNANNLLKKSNKRSLFETNENIKKEKTKIINNNDNQNNQIQKKIMDSIDNANVSKKISSKNIKIKKMNKIKKNVITKKNKIDINDEILLNIKNNKEKYSTNNTNQNTNTNTNTISIINLNNSTINESHNSNIIKNKFIIKDNKNLMNKEKNNIQNKLNKSEIFGDEKVKTIAQLSDNNIKKHFSGVSDNISNLNKNIKSSKNERFFKKNSKLIEIDISNKGIISKKISFHENNPFNVNEEKKKSHSFLFPSCKEIKSSKIVNKKNNKQKITTKKNSNKSNSIMQDSIGDN